MTTSDPDPERDLEVAELMESTASQNAVAATGPAALVVIPISRLLVAIQRRMQGWRRRR